MQGVPFKRTVRHGQRRTLLAEQWPHQSAAWPPPSSPAGSAWPCWPGTHPPCVPLSPPPAAPASVPHTPAHHGIKTHHSSTLKPCHTAQSPVLSSYACTPWDQDSPLKYAKYLSCCTVTSPAPCVTPWQVQVWPFHASIIFVLKTVCFVLLTTASMSDPHSICVVPWKIGLCYEKRCLQVYSQSLQSECTQLHWLRSRRQSHIANATEASGLPGPYSPVKAESRQDCQWTGWQGLVW